MNPFQAFVESIPKTNRETTCWSFYDGQIWKYDIPLDIHEFDNIFKVVARYFREWQLFADLEAQVLVVSNLDYGNYYTHFPVLPCDSEHYKMIILPQINTSTNTIIDDAYWYKTVKGQPVMRIHSHHKWAAYQSQTDFTTLNSGTLEVVLGNIDQDVITIAYWLTRYSDESVKSHTFSTTL